jgi:hypothetical protein
MKFLTTLLKSEGHVFESQPERDNPGFPQSLQIHAGIGMTATSFYNLTNSSSTAISLLQAVKATNS